MPVPAPTGYSFMRERETRARDKELKALKRGSTSTT